MKRAFPIILGGRAIININVMFLLFIRWSKAPDMPIGWYCAGSKVIDDKALGGFSPCDNLPKKYANDFPAPDGQVSLLAFPDEVIEQKWFQAITLRLVN